MWFYNGKLFIGVIEDCISIIFNRLEYVVIYSKDFGVYQCFVDNGYEIV